MLLSLVQQYLLNKMAKETTKENVEKQSEKHVKEPAKKGSRKENANKKDMATLNVRDLPISTKHSVEICHFIRNKELSNAKTILSNVIDKKRAIPYKRYNTELAHRAGKIGPGRYPVKTAKQILSLLESIEANAEDVGLDTKNLIINEIRANKGTRQLHFGRKRSRLMKRTHIFMSVKEK